MVINTIVTTISTVSDMHSSKAIRSEYTTHCLLILDCFLQEDVAAKF